MAETEILKLDPDSPPGRELDRAAAIIQSGGLVAFPTETVYGLGADAMNQAAVVKIFEAKGRPADNPLIVHIGNPQMLAHVAADAGQQVTRLIERFWPGPLTLVLRRNPRVAPSVSAGLSTVAVRMPGSPVALELIRRAGTPVAAPSANASGRPSPTSAEHVANDLAGKIDLILDGGPTRIGIESTVLDMTADPPVILRPGWVTFESLSEILGGKVSRSPSDEELERSPGTRHRHYSPRARVVLVLESPPGFIRRLCRDYLQAGPVGFAGHSDVDISDPKFRKILTRPRADEYGRSIYKSFRELDSWGARVIIVEGIGGGGEAEAVMDRLRRAASEVIIQGRRSMA